MINIEYNRQDAVNYANRWALSRNPAYYDYSNIGGDCTNFASQVLYAGTGVMNYNRENGWYYINANDKSPSWTGVNFFYDFIVNNDGLGPYGEESILSPQRLKFFFLQCLEYYRCRYLKKLRNQYNRFRS